MFFLYENEAQIQLSAHDHHKAHMERRVYYTGLICEISTGKSKSHSYSSLSQFSDSQSLVSRKRISDESSLCSAVTDGEEMMLEDKGKPGEKQTN